MDPNTPISFNEPEDAQLIENVELYKEFISESCVRLQYIEANILFLEKNPNDSEIFNCIFRSVHTIKVSANFMGLEKIQKLSYELETVLVMVRNSELVVSMPITDVLLNSIDTLGRLIDSFASRVSRVANTMCETLGKSNSEGDIDIKLSIDAIRAILESNKIGSDKILENVQRDKGCDSKPEDI